MRRVSVFLIFIHLSLIVFSQNIVNSGLKDKSKQLVSSEYDRNSLTILNLAFPGKYTSLLESIAGSVKIPEKYFDNTLSNAMINPEAGRESLTIPLHPYKLLNTGSVTDMVNKAQIGRKIVAKWFNRDPNGIFNVDLLKERGIYNATDNDVLVADASKRGNAGLMDMGMGLIDKSYVLVLDFPELMTMEEVYNRDTVPANKRTMNGFTGKMNGYLYKLNFGEEQAAVFYQDLWVSATTPDAKKRKEKFDQYTFPLTFIKVYSEDISATQFNQGQLLAPKVQKTQTEMLKMFVETGIQQCLTKVENTNESFRVKAMIYKTNPIAVKIGRKEGLKFDQRYFVYENRQNRKGETYSVRRGVIRSMSVTDNRNVASGETKPSLFYQIAGKKIDNMGMFIQQKNALGLNLFLGGMSGYSTESSPGFSGRLDIGISSLLYEAIVKKGKSALLKSLKLYADVSYNQENYLDDFDFLRYSFGLSKEIFLTRNSFLEPYVGYGLEEATWSVVDTDDKISSDFIEYGGRLGINLSPGIQLMGGVNLFSAITSQFKVIDKEPQIITYSDYFEGRTGPCISAGFRFTF